MELMKRSLGLWFLILMGFFSSSQSYNFFVGGKDGWVLNPSQNYTQWIARNRFQVNDTLHFKYKKGSDSVLVVSKDNYLSCNTQNPIVSLTDGESNFKFDRSGPFFFISGNVENCNKGLKLTLVVMAVRNRTQSTPPASSPAALTPSPAGDAPMFPPLASSPVSGAPESGGSTSDMGSPAPAPAHRSGSPGVCRSSMGWVLGIMSAVLCSFVGLG